MSASWGCISSRLQRTDQTIIAQAIHVLIHCAPGYGHHVWRIQITLHLQLDLWQIRIWLLAIHHSLWYLSAILTTVDVHLNGWLDGSVVVDDLVPGLLFIDFGYIGGLFVVTNGRYRKALLALHQLLLLCIGGCLVICYLVALLALGNVFIRWVGQYFDVVLLSWAGGVMHQHGWAQTMRIGIYIGLLSWRRGKVLEKWQL